MVGHTGQSVSSRSRVMAWIFDKFSMLGENTA